MSFRPLILANHKYTAGSYYMPFTSIGPTPRPNLKLVNGRYVQVFVIASALLTLRIFIYHLENLRRRMYGQHRDICRRVEDILSSQQ